MLAKENAFREVMARKVFCLSSGSLLISLMKSCFGFWCHGEVSTPIRWGTLLNTERNPLCEKRVVAWKP